MMIYPFLQLFFFTLITSTLIALSSHHWTVVWMALELNMISFIPIISSSSWHQEHEASLKYLMFQALGSSLLLLFSFNSSMVFLVAIALSIKLGAAPFHFWFPSVMKSISWGAATLLLTWQKIAPMMMMFSCFNNKPLLCSIGLASAITGGIGGVNQTHIRSLLAYSSIGHMGWIITGLTFSPAAAAGYFMIYLLLSAPLALTCLMSNTSMIKNTLNPHNNQFQKTLIPMMLSLGGLPPFIGFIPKLLILMSMKSLLIPLILMISSLMNLTYYLNFAFTALLSQDQLKTSKKKVPLSFLITTSLWMSTSPVPLLSVMFIFM